MWATSFFVLLARISDDKLHIRTMFMRNQDQTGVYLVICVGFPIISVF